MIPKIHNVHTCFARRPTGVSRIITLLATLGSSPISGSQELDLNDVELATGLYEAYSKR